MVIDILIIDKIIDKNGYTDKIINGDRCIDKSIDKNRYNNKTAYGDKRGFGGNAPNKLKASAEGKGSELASDPCRRHGHKLVPYICDTDWKREEG
jgi:hypothetical protein